MTVTTPPLPLPVVTRRGENAKRGVKLSVFSTKNQLHRLVWCYLRKAGHCVLSYIGQVCDLPKEKQVGDLRYRIQL